MIQPGSRPVTLLLLGHVDHGKSTLLRTMLGLPRESGSAGPDPRDLAETEIPLGWGLAHRRVERIVQTARREYRVIDCPGHQDAVKAIATGASRPDAALLIVSAVDGPLAQTREQLLLAGEAGIELAAVFLSKVDATSSASDATSSASDGGVVDRVEKEVRDLLRDCGHDGDRGALGSVPIVRGSAMSESSVSTLVGALDERIADPPPEEGPFLFRVDSVVADPERGLVATGFVLRGVIGAGQAVEAIGFSREAPQAFVVGRVESGRHRQKRAR
ncbi:MAG: hypothetical protein HKN20_12050, partial [Gemmatimonadetes bacterium]|nr:hypothetical protein [Gemmatimonadota bacterium]